MRPDAAIHELTLLPPIFGGNQKFSFLVSSGQTPVGFVDLLQGYPTGKVAMLGLFVIAESHQGKGFGRLAYIAVEDFARETLRSERIRIGVNDSNPVHSFWEKMGFSLTGERKPYEGIARKSEVAVLDKSLLHR